jgi:hypothetical protein
MKFTLEIDLDEESLTFTEMAKAIKNSLTLYSDAVAVGNPPELEDSGVIVDPITAKTIGKWEIGEPAAIRRNSPRHQLRGNALLRCCRIGGTIEP